MQGVFSKSRRDYGKQRCKPDRKKFFTPYLLLPNLQQAPAGQAHEVHAASQGGDVYSGVGSAFQQWLSAQVQDADRAFHRRLYLHVVVPKNYQNILSRTVRVRNIL